MDFDDKHQSIKVVYFTFEGRGGMLHYAQNMAANCGGFVDSTLVVISEEKVTLETNNNVPLLNVLWSKGSGFKKLFEVYNPFFYRKIAKRICRDLKPDLVHVTSKGLGLLSIIAYFRIRKIKVVYTVHDPTPHEERMTMWSRIVHEYQRRWQLPRVMQRCSALHVHSETHHSLLRQIYQREGTAPVYVVPHGAGLSRQIEESNNIPPELINKFQAGIPTILFFGRIEPYKGLEYLVKAMRLLEFQGMRVNLIVAGAGDIPKDLFHGLEMNVILINRFIADSEIKGIFNACNVVALPYISATQSGVIPMAYLFEKPVIVTKVGALPEMVIDGETGTLIEPMNSKQLADALRDLLRHPANLRWMGKNARQYAVARLGWSTLMRYHLARYQDICRNRPINRS